MKLLFDFLPIVLFFIAYKFKGIYFATLVAIIITAIQVIFSWFINKKVETVQIVTLVSILVLGGATIFLQNELFIKWKPTAINWLFAIALFASHFIGKQTIIQKLMSHSIQLPQFIWHRLNLSWAIFFASIGAINIYVIYNFDTDTWVNFKLFGILGITIAFVILQSIFMAKYIEKN